MHLACAGNGRFETVIRVIIRIRYMGWKCSLGLATISTNVHNPVLVIQLALLLLGIMRLVLLRSLS